MFIAIYLCVREKEYRICFAGYTNGVFGNSQIAIVGQGYVGLPLAIQASKRGFKVVAIEQDQSRLRSLRYGVSYIEDVTSEEIRAAIDSGNYQATSDFSEISSCSAIIVCVPTPITLEKNPDLGNLINAMQSIATYISPKSLVVSESTSYPGTLRQVIEPIFKGSNKSPSKIFFAVAPERINPGGSNFLNVPRVVSGLDEESSRKVYELYSNLGFEVILASNPEVAEAAKLLENTFRQVNIALVNDFAKIMHKLQINTREVIEMAATKPYGFMRFDPGPGVGGHCIPVDPHYLIWAGKQVNYESSFIISAIGINDEMPYYVISRIEDLIKDALLGRRILIAGIAYKRGISDLRESPAVELISGFKSKGASTFWYDPLVESFEGELPASIDAAYDIVVITLPGLELPINKWIDAETVIFDCTGHYASFPEVNQL